MRLKIEKYLSLIILLTLIISLGSWQINSSIAAQVQTCEPADSPGLDGTGKPVVDPDCPGMAPRNISPAIPPGVGPVPQPGDCVSLSITPEVKTCYTTAELRLGGGSVQTSYRVTATNRCLDPVTNVTYNDNRGNSFGPISLTSSGGQHSETFSFMLSVTTTISGTLRGTLLDGTGFMKFAQLTIAVRDSCAGCELDIPPLLQHGWGYGAEENSWCGIASAAMLFGYYIDPNPNPDDVYKTCCAPPCSSCYNWAGCGAQQYLGSALSSTPLSSSQSEYMQSLWDYVCEQNKPVIARVTVRGDTPHFVLVRGINTTNVIFNDPLSGREEISQSSFWTYVQNWPTDDTRYQIYYY